MYQFRLLPEKVIILAFLFAASVPRHISTSAYRNDFYYIQPELSWVPNSPVWFNSQCYQKSWRFCVLPVFPDIDFYIRLLSSDSANFSQDTVRSRNDLYYLQPERSCVPDSPVWFSGTQELPEPQIDKMLRRILMVREVQEHMLADGQQQ